MRIVVTGSRTFSNVSRMRKVLQDLGANVTIVHGGARGADMIAGYTAKALGFPVEVFPADWDTHGKKAGVLRNQEMLNAGADLCLAFPTSGCAGTWDCVNKAKKMGVPVIVFES